MWRSKLPRSNLWSGCVFACFLWATYQSRRCFSSKPSRYGLICCWFSTPCLRPIFRVVSPYARRVPGKLHITSQHLERNRTISVLNHCDAVQMRHTSFLEQDFHFHYADAFLLYSLVDEQRIAEHLMIEKLPSVIFLARRALVWAAAETRWTEVCVDL